MSDLNRSHLAFRKPRTMGLIYVVISGLIGWWQIYVPIHAAEAHKKQVWLSMQIIGLGIFFALYGITLLAFGKKTNDFILCKDKKVMVWQFIASVLWVAVGIGIFFLVNAKLKEQGFR